MANFSFFFAVVSCIFTSLVESVAEIRLAHSARLMWSVSTTLRCARSPNDARPVHTTETRREGGRASTAHKRTDWVVGGNEEKHRKTYPNATIST